MIRQSARISSATCAAMLLASVVAKAEVPVIDKATLSQATKTAEHTSEIMKSNANILETVNKTLEAVTGNRDTASIASAALGNGFSMGGAPNLGSLMGGQMAWGNLGEFGQVAATILNGLNLVKSLSNNQDTANLSGTDKAWQGAVNTSAAITGMISGTQSAAAQRSQAFQQAGQMIGSAPDLKGSIDQNSQIQTQTAQTINELIGVQNATNAAINAEHMQELAAQAKAARIFGIGKSGH
uniref:Type IV secretion protein n=1 Tax=Ochrobactrum sp. LM19 TaxID=1449781 RepID=A0A0D5A0D7_9HYPH|nr:type IV secretion system protein [Ochrobactrum sp. LM19]AJW30002.1 type IV secretion protein [Ochrobactrum sp. LM19]